MTDRIPLDHLTSDALDALYEQLEAAEAAIARARALAERWRYTGDRKEGPLRELRQALDAQPAPAPATPAWTPPPPGSTREQLPAHILALLDGRLPDYRSTACQTADAVACAADVDGYRLYDEIRAHAERLHERCRLNHKFTGQLCACGCHPQPEPDTITDPAWLRDQYATAVEGCGIESLLDCGEIADAVLRVRDRHVEQLRQRLTLADQFHRTVVAERDRLAATIREVLALFQRATVCGRTAFYQATEHPIHPDDYDRWTAALPKEPTR